MNVLGKIQHSIMENETVNYLIALGPQLLRSLLVCQFNICDNHVKEIKTF